MAVTIAADGFGPQDLPQVYQPPVNLKTSRRQARYDKWRFAGTAVTLNPDGVKVKDAILTLTPHSDSSIGNLKSNEKLEMFAWSVEEQAWEYAPNSLAKSGTVSATLSHFSLYVPVITELGNPVVFPSPGPLPNKSKSRGTTDGEIAAAVIVPLLAMAAACFVLYWLSCKRQKRPVSPGPLIESSVGFDTDTAPAPAPVQAPALSPAGAAAAPPVSAIPCRDTCEEPMAMLEMSAVLPDEWHKCTGCESPIKASWPRCPTCRTENKGSGELVVRWHMNRSKEVAADHHELVLDGLQEPKSAPQEVRVLNALQEQQRAPEEVIKDVDPAIRDFTGTCPQCAAPVKGTWNR
jgi:hypothetical protein